MIIKKIVSGVLALAMFTTVITVPMLSSAADAVTVSGEHDTAKAGGTFALDFSLTNVPKEGISGWEFSIKYDSSVLTVDSLEAGAAITSTRATAGETELVPGFGGEGYMVGNGSTYDTFDYNIISGGEITAMWATGLNDSKYWIDEAGVVFTLNGTVSDKAELGKDYIFEIQAIDREGNNEMMFCYYADNKDNFYDSSVAQDGKLTIVKDPDISTPSETVTTLTTSEPTGTTPSETVTTLTTSEPTGTTPSETVTTLTTSEPTGTTSSETVTTLTTSEPTGTTPSETVTSPTTSEPTGTTPSETVTTVTTTEPTGTSTSETTTSEQTRRGKLHAVLQQGFQYGLHRTAAHRRTRLRRADGFPQKGRQLYAHRKRMVHRARGQGRTH